MKNLKRKLLLWLHYKLLFNDLVKIQDTILIPHSELVINSDRGMIKKEIAERISYHLIEKNLLNIKYTNGQEHNMNRYEIELIILKD